MKPVRINPTAQEVAVAVGATLLAVGTAGGLAVYAMHRYRRRQESRAPIDSVTPKGGAEESPRGGPERPNEPAPAPTKPYQLPDIILAGGVPLEPGWKTVAWYRHPASSNNPFWIRVDQYGIPTWSEYTSADLNLSDEESPFKNEFGKNLKHGHFGRIEGAWRWTVIGGEATPIATELLEGAYLFRRPLIYLRYDQESLENGMLDYAAQGASDWIDAAFGL